MFKMRNASALLLLFALLLSACGSTETAGEEEQPVEPTSAFFSFDGTDFLLAEAASREKKRVAFRHCSTLGEARDACGIGELLN